MVRRCLSLLVLSGALSGQTATENCAVLVLTPSNSASLCAQNTAPDPSAILDLSASNTYHSLCNFDSLELLLGVTVIDGPGPDLEIDEENSNIAELYGVDVSPDGTTWTTLLGPYTGGAFAGDSAIDLAGTGVTSVLAVRLRDLSGAATGGTPGPDFDSIVCINYQLPLFSGVVRPYADILVSYDPAGVALPYGDGLQALGPPNAYRSEAWTGTTTTSFAFTWNNFVSLPQGSSLTVSFSEHSIVDGVGADFIVHEYYSAEGNQFTVQVSDDGVHWSPATLVGSSSPTHGTGAVSTNNVQGFDLFGSGLSSADYVRIVSTSTASTGTTPGAELDAIEVVNSIARPRNLRLVNPIASGSVGTIDLIAPFHAGQLALTFASIGSPTAPGAGLALGAGIEYRLSLADPLVQFLLTDPIAPLVFAGTAAFLPPSGVTPISVTLPVAPGVVGLDIWWQSGLISGSSVTGVSNILLTTIQ